MTNWLDVVKTVAPSLATALGGPLAGTATTALSDAIFGKTESPDVLEETIEKADPATLAALKQAELNFQATIAELDIDLERIHAGDRADARKRETEVRDRTPATMGGFVLVGFFAAFAAMLLIPFPDASKEALFILLGVLGGMANSVTSYYFGSSSGSEQKNAMFLRKTDG